MRKWLLSLSLLFLVACQPDGGGNGNSVANPPTTPLTTNCLNGTTYCNNQLYAQYPGFQPYPGLYSYAYNYMNHFNRNGFCNCPLGTMPVYNGSLGLGCVQQQYLQPYSGFFLYWQWGTGNVGWGTIPYYGYGYGYSYGYPAPQMPINMPQYSNIPTAPNSYASCFRNLTQSCVIGQANACGVGATCRQVVAGSGLGICMSGL